MLSASGPGFNSQLGPFCYANPFDLLYVTSSIPVFLPQQFGAQTCCAGNLDGNSALCKTHLLRSQAFIHRMTVLASKYTSVNQI